MPRLITQKKSPLPPDETLVIEKFSHDGRGLAKSAGKVVLVSGALPGETCHVRYQQANSKLRQATALKISQPSEQRVQPKCSLYGQCGGCQLQHVSHSSQIELKQQAIAEHFQRNDIAIKQWSPALVSASFAYRHRARLHVNKQGRPGFHGLKNKQVITVEQCPIFTDELQQAFDQLRQQAQLNGVQELELVIDDFGKVGLAILKASATASKSLTQWAETQNWQVNQPLRYRAGNSIALAMPGDFTQVNRAINKVMQQCLQDWAQLTQSDRLVDLFCGNGNLSMGLTDKVAAVLGLESNEQAIAFAQQVASKNALFQVENLFTEDLQVQEKLQHFAPTVAFIDPPRAGAQQLCQRLSKVKSLRKILYVSCDPATLARDLHSLRRDKWHLRKVALVDMFPQTRHIETMVMLEK